MTEPILSGKRLNDESAYATEHLSKLAKLNVRLPGDYAPPVQERARKPAVVGIELTDPPEVKEGQAVADASIQLDIKCSKPVLQFTLGECSLASSIGALKEALANEHKDKAPIAADQKWLIKGKVLQDAKLLREYTEQGTSITLMLKPGSTFGTPTTKVAETSEKLPETSKPNTLSSSTTSNPGRGHIRVPSLTLNTTDLEPETDRGPIHTRPRSLSATFTSKMADPTFWKETLDFLEQHVGPANCVKAWEEWFSVSKQWLTPSDVGRIREEVGVLGMGGH